MTNLKKVFQTNISKYFRTVQGQSRDPQRQVHCTKINGKNHIFYTTLINENQHKKLDSKDKTFFYSNLTEVRQITFQIPRCSSSSPPTL